MYPYLHALAVRAGYFGVFYFCLPLIPYAQADWMFSLPGGGVDPHLHRNAGFFLAELASETPLNGTCVYFGLYKGWNTGLYLRYPRESCFVIKVILHK